MKYLKFLMVAGLVTLVSAGAGAVMLYPEVGDTGNIGTALPSQDISSQEESMIQPPIEDIETGVAKEEKEELDGNAYGIKDHQLKLEELEIEPDKKDVPSKKLNEKINEIIDKIKQFYGVDDISELGKLGEHLEEMLKTILESGNNIDNLELKEVYKNGKYVLELNWSEKRDKETIHNTLTFEGKIDENGNIAPSKVSWEKVYDDGTVGVRFPTETHTFTFDSKGIASETHEYTERRPLVNPIWDDFLKNKTQG